MFSHKEFIEKYFTVIFIEGFPWKTVRTYELDCR